MMRMHGRTTTWVTLTAALVASGCGDDSTEGTGGGGEATASSSSAATTNAASSGSTAATSTSTGVAGRDISVRVYEDGAGDPIEGALVALDANGVRQESATDADGRVTFSDVDVSADDVRATTWAAGFGFGSVPVVDFDEEMPITIYRRPPTDESVAVSGTAVGMVNEEDDYLLLSTDYDFSPAWQAIGPDFTVRAPNDRDTTMVALEFESVTNTNDDSSIAIPAWTMTTVPAGGEEIDLDFAETLDPVEVAGSFSRPLPADSPLAQSGRGYTFTYQGSTLLTGVYTSCVTSEDRTRTEYTHEYVEPGVEGAAYTIYQVIQTNIGASAGFVVPGVPEDGDVDVEYFGPPAREGTGTMTSDQELVWTNDGNPDDVILRIYDASFAFSSFVTFRPGSSKGRLPELPTGAADLATLFAGDTGIAYLGTCGDIIDAEVVPGGFCSRFSNGPAFELEVANGGQ